MYWIWMQQLLLLTLRVATGQWGLPQGGPESSYLASVISYSCHAAREPCQPPARGCMEKPQAHPRGVTASNSSVSCCNSRHHPTIAPWEPPAQRARLCPSADPQNFWRTGTERDTKMIIVTKSHLAFWQFVISHYITQTECIKYTSMFLCVRVRTYAWVCVYLCICTCKSSKVKPLSAERLPVNGQRGNERGQEGCREASLYRILEI